MRDTQDAWRLNLSMLAVTVPLMVAIALSLVFLTGWPAWVASAVGGAVGGLAGPLAVRWILARRERGRDRSPSTTER
ncbi:hypothetical protein Q8791_21595 [Nocardiopsis sp. CT-R113]|uniref:Uncharacterized protein n=1 Tax=Nocardiopsis codii TaxID=3065942 RepID=A0ABU7KC56_9ACTN|nr:hypothetical protein [Nocardiopsis sp. CT-R113]MEE2039815.1 hypothetical protein [Nocardiopsis sp. CT-R113]